ncbi:MAG: energy-coupling factor transporter ATPase [Clostridia bacterium]
MIEINNITFKYDKDASPAIENVTLSIKEGEFLAVVGHNGSGKSTLAKHLNALLLPSEGNVLVYGMDTSDPDKTIDIRRHVGMVFQNPDNQLVTTVVEEDIAFGPENIGVPQQEIISRVNMALKAVGMEKYRSSAPHMLSGGQKQRIAIAGMLALKPDVLVLDEATAMLDPIGRNEILNIAYDLNKFHGITVVMITQYMEEAVFSDRVAVMANGRLMMLDTPRRIFSQSNRLRSLGLDVPAVVDLRNRLIAKGLKPTNAITAKELVDVLCPLF